MTSTFFIIWWFILGLYGSVLAICGSGVRIERKYPKEAFDRWKYLKANIPLGLIMSLLGPVNFIFGLFIACSG